MTRKLAGSALAILVALGPCMQAAAEDPGGGQYCGQLAQIGASAWRTRVDGYPVEQVLREVRSILGSHPHRLEQAEDVIVEIYQDRSVSSASQAYRKVYADCRH
jgi:hypothetical protein